MAEQTELLETGEESLLEDKSDSRRAFGRAGKVMAAFSVAGVAVLGLTRRVPRIDTVSTTLKGDIQLDQVVVQRPRSQCSPPWTSKSSPDNTTENCIHTGCCTITGWNCFSKGPGVAGCLNGCNSKQNGWECKMRQEDMDLKDAEHAKNTDFYCFGVHTSDSGRPDHFPGPKEELALFREQYAKKVGSFACPAYAIFSDVEVNIGKDDNGKDFNTIKVEDIESEFHLIKRKKTKTWVNTGMFKQVWKKIDEMGDWKKFEWIIKLDADAVFVPDRLRAMLSKQLVTRGGVYIENCAEVNQGFFGNVEVLSKEAFSKLVSSLETCGKNIKWASSDATAWGPIGEDLFAQMCMDDNGVDKIQDFGLTTDGACPGIKKKWGHGKDKKPFSPDCTHLTTPVMHPFKTVDKWFECYHKTMAIES